MYKVYKLIDANETIFGWEYIVVGEKYITRILNMDNLRVNEEKTVSGQVYEYELECLVFSRCGCFEPIYLDEDDFREEVSSFIYKLIFVCELLDTAMDFVRIECIGCDHKEKVGSKLLRLNPHSNNEEK